ncbi:hypothetical protein Tco_0785515 [Tanacetum coccineum]
MAENVIAAERESKLYDEFDRFTSEPGESIHSYYWRYAKLINDMNIIKMSMSKIQINTKFVNHLQPEWSRFDTPAKQAKDLHEVNFDQLCAFLKDNEKDAKENVQGRQSQGYAVNAGKSQATGARLSIQLERQTQINQGQSGVTTSKVKLHTTSNFKADHIDAYDSDSDEEATANVQEMEYSEHFVSNNNSYDEFTSDTNVISYDDYMVIIENDAA